MRRNIALYPLYRILTLEGLAQGVYVFWFVGVQKFPAATVALFLGLSDFVLLALQYPTGRMADRWGRRPSMLLGSAFQLLGAWLCWQAATVPQLAMALVSIAVGDAFRSGAQEALLYEACDSAEEFNRQAAVSQVALLVALVLLTAAGGYLAAHCSYAAVWKAEMLLATLGLAVVPVFRESRRAPDSAPLLAVSVPAGLWRPILLGSVTCAAGSVAGFMRPLMGQGPQTAAAYIAIYVLAEALGTGLAGRFPAHGRTLTRCACVALVALLFPPLFPAVYAAIGVTVIVRMTVVYSRADDSNRATLGSLAALFDMTAKALVLPTAGWLFGPVGATPTLATCATVLVLAGLASRLGADKPGAPSEADGGRSPRS